MFGMMVNGHGESIALNMNITRKYFTVAFVAIAVIGIMASCGKLVESVKRRNCKQQLSSVWVAIALYRQNHTNQYPPNLERLNREMGGHLPLACPGAETNLLQSIQDRIIDYYYIDWSELSGVANVSTYPQIYDRRLSNHEGRGINILMVNGSVKWDSNAEWLKRFSAEHPNTKVPIPE